MGVSRDCPIFSGTPYGEVERANRASWRESGRLAWSSDRQRHLSNVIQLVNVIISGTGKATDFKFCVHIYRLNRNKSGPEIFNGLFKSPLKISGKVAVFVVRDS